MFKYYKYAAIWPAMVAIPTMVIFSVIANMSYKSEWLTADAVIWMASGTVFAYSMFLCLLATPIFLVGHPRIARNRILIVLCWFLLPISFMIWVFAHELRMTFALGEAPREDFLFNVLLNLPFLVGLAWSYLRYVADSRK